jgi:murein DD-endopeptidase MepM/ murein hydrolase activator NlpD
MIGDNTGFSTGPHTHLGLYRLDDNKNKLDQNEATGSYNPAGFFYRRLLSATSRVIAMVTTSVTTRDAGFAI